MSQSSIKKGDREVRILHVEDIVALPPDARRDAMNALLAIAVDPLDPPGHRAGALRNQYPLIPADLSGFRTITFGSAVVPEHVFRAVYKIVSGSYVEVWAIGQRRGSKVYLKVCERLRPRKKIQAPRGRVPRAS